ncbi:putative Uncharacterized protein family UPF0434/Trm112 protein [Trachipleistophora hominis]|uniref:Uncharacterized protein n=1 Tax=Trachipleistophora hominis TaxID=72359 RepID=L7JVH3_TRAHO|nr:putative Uncharacterized protein family UPF0434/Trm112 protein [Trachipleistophora hominis]
MLPFTFSILKCNSCDFTQKLRLMPTKVHKITPASEFYREVDEDTLESLRKSFESVEGIYKLEDDTRMFLFGNVVDEGKIFCDGCGVYFPIEDGIVDFVNPVKVDGNEALTEDV